MKPGIYPGMSFEEYCKIPAINKSGLDLVADSPLHYWAGYLDPERGPREETPAMKLGSAIHTILLEPHLFDQKYAVVPDDAPRRPTALQLNAKKPSLETMEAIEFWEKFNANTAGKTILTAEQVQSCRAIQNSVLKSKAAQTLLTDGKAEVTVVWEKNVLLDDGTEVIVPCKARIDYLTAMAILDVKSTSSAAPAAFAKSVANYHYHLQAAWYSDGFFSITGEKLPFVFLAFETAKPYACAFYLAEENVLEVGRKLYSPLLKKYAECVNKNYWPGYPDEIRTLKLPVWAEKEYSYDGEV